MTKLLYQENQSVAHIILNNPEKFNAFDEAMILEWIDLLKNITKQKSVRAVILRGNGPHFCTGADLNWMRKMQNASKADNEKDAGIFAELLERLNQLNKPLVGLAQGRTMGGGLGFLACCDIVVAETSARFCFSETRLGLIPAIIAPYVVQKMGISQARRLFVSAEIFSAQSAQQMQLVHHIVEDKNLLSEAEKITDLLVENGPQAMVAVKQLLQDIAPVSKKIQQLTIQRLASIRVSEEAQEGMNAFLSKRTPSWIE